MLSKIILSVTFFLFGLDIKAQLLDYKDEALSRDYKSAISYPLDSLTKYLSKKNELNVIIQKKDSLIPLNFCFEKNCIIRFIDFSIFDYKDSLSLINYVVFQIIHNNPKIKTIILTARHTNLGQSKIKYNFSGLNPAYLKKWINKTDPNIRTKVFALSDVNRDYQNLPNKINYLDLLILF